MVMAAYFDEFRVEWTRVHKESLRDLPILERAGALVGKTTMRLSDDARKLLETVGGARAITCTEEIPTVWRVIRPAEKSSEGEKERPRVFVPGRAERHAVSMAARVCCQVLDVDRCDRARITAAPPRLSAEAFGMLSRLSNDISPLPECPEIWFHQPKKTESKISTEPTEPESFAAFRGIVKPKLRSIEICLSRREVQRFYFGWHQIAAQAKDVFSVITKESKYTRPPDNAQTSIFERSRSRELYEHIGLNITVPLLATSVGSRESAITERSSVPSWIKFDGFFKPAASAFSLADAARTTLKQVVKRNASIVLVQAIPTSLSSEIGSLLRCGHTLHAYNCDQGSNGNGVRLMALPSEVISEDEDRLRQSQQSVSVLAQQVFKLIPPPPVSQTSLSLGLPTIWAQTALEQCAWRLKAQVLDIDDALDDAEATYDHPSSKAHEENAILHQSSSNCEAHKQVVTEVPTKIVIDPASSTTRDNARDENVTDVSSHVALPKCSKQVTFKVEDLSTDDLVTSFLGEESGQDHQLPPNSERVEMSTLHSVDISKSAELATTIDQLARPGIWFLSRVKLLKVQSVSLAAALKSIPLEVLETISLQLHAKLKGISANPAKMPTEDITATCSAFRHAVWLHGMRMLLESDDLRTEETLLVVTSRLLSSSKYRCAFGRRQTESLTKLYTLVGGSLDALQLEGSLTTSQPYAGLEGPPRKKVRDQTVQSELSSVRLLCTIKFLERDELLEAMSELSISVIERDLPPAIDIVVDEHNAVILLSKEHFFEEHVMKMLTYELATAQLQFATLWIIIDNAEGYEATLQFFFAALTNFTARVQVFICHDEFERSQVIRAIVDSCAEEALSQHRILPKMWFARPFMLEDESQLERLLSSTRVINAFAAQSVLYRLSFDELITKSLDELSLLIGSSLASTQLSLLWSMLHTCHGIANGELLAT